MNCSPNAQSSDRSDLSERFNLAIQFADSMKSSGLVGIRDDPLALPSNEREMGDSQNLGEVREVRTPPLNRGDSSDGKWPTKVSEPNSVFSTIFPAILIVQTK